MRDENFYFYDATNSQQDATLENLVSPNQEEALTELLDEVAQSAYNDGYEGKAFDEPSELSSKFDEKVAPDDRSDLLDLMKAVLKNAYDAGAGQKQEDGEEEAEADKEDDDDSDD